MKTYLHVVSVEYMTVMLCSAVSVSVHGAIHGNKEEVYLVSGQWTYSLTSPVPTHKSCTH